MDSSRVAAAAASAALLVPLSGCATETYGASRPAASVEPAATTPSGPVAPGTYEPQPSDPASMRNAWQRWAALNEDDYNTSVDRSCFCPPQPAVLSRVRAGKVVYVARADRPGHEVEHRGYTMDRLYLMLRSAYRDAYSVEVRYTADGAPKRISIDYEERTIDEEQYFKVSLQRR